MQDEVKTSVKISPFSKHPLQWIILWTMERSYPPSPPPCTFQSGVVRVIAFSLVVLVLSFTIQFTTRDYSLKKIFQDLFFCLVLFSTGWFLLLDSFSRKWRRWKWSHQMCYWNVTANRECCLMTLYHTPGSLNVMTWHLLWLNLKCQHRGQRNKKRSNLSHRHSYLFLYFSICSEPLSGASCFYIFNSWWINTWTKAAHTTYRYDLFVILMLAP